MLTLGGSGGVQGDPWGGRGGCTFFASAGSGRPFFDDVIALSGLGTSHARILEGSRPECAMTSSKNCPPSLPLEGLGPQMPPEALRNTICMLR